MRIIFEDKDPAVIVDEIVEALQGRKLGEMVSFELENDDLNVTIQKMGKSYLSFTHHRSNGQLEWELTKEKIAFSHKAFKSDMLEKLIKVINSIGGEVIN